MTISEPPTGYTLQDIRPATPPEDLYTAIKWGLTASPKQLPSLLLWDADGHKLFERITKSTSYYGTRADQDIMVEHMNQICDMIGEDGILLELGSGSIPNTHRILEELNRRSAKVNYFAHDVCKEQLCSSLEALSTRLSLSPEATDSAIQLKGIVGTYDDLIEWLVSQTIFRNRPLVVLWLGNSLSSYSDPQLSHLLNRLSTSLAKTQALTSRLIFAVDGCKNEHDIKTAYNAPDSTSSQFVANGLRHANRVLNRELFRADEWEPTCCFDEKEKSITWGFRTPCARKLAIDNVTAVCTAGETIEIIQSRKRDRRSIVACTAVAPIEMAEVWQMPSVLWSWYVLKVVSI